MPFVDTNVLLYAVSDKPADKSKAVRANEILGRRDLVLSTQVLSEFYVQATRPSRTEPLSEELARGFVQAFSRFPVEPITSAIVMAAIETRTRFSISYWDAAIIEAARASGCGEVLSEDLSDGQDYGGVVVRNPFARPE